MVITVATVALIAYLLGSFPAGCIVSKLAGVDIRQVGSGNVGATNVTRVLGKRFGYPVFIVDFAKGLAAVLTAVAIAKATRASPAFTDLCVSIAAFFSVIGHSYSPWLRFSGGKGVATSLGCLFGINWMAAIAVCIVWLVVFQITKYVSLASIVAAITLPVAVAVTLFFKQRQSPVLLYFSLCLAAIIVLRHRSNLSRLMKGTEPRFARK